MPTGPSEPSPPAGHRPWIVWLVLLPVVLAAAAAVAVHRIEPPGPGPFYDTPDPLPPGAPGTIIRSEPIAGGPAGATTTRVLYLSTGDDGVAVAVSGVVFVPDAPAPADGRSVVAWAHPTTGVASRCAPSLESGGGASAIPGLGELLAAGYVVTATDYPGLGTAGPHPYLVGEREGDAVLDSVRAARALPGSGASDRFAVWGHSQGGHAALFAGQRAPTYAPELRLVAVATAAPATDLAGLLKRDVGGVAGNVLASMALVSWSEVFATDGLRIEQVVDPLAVPTARMIAAGCIETDAQLAVDLPNAEVLRLRFLSADPWQVPGWAEALATNTPGATPIAAPVLVNQGTADTVVWPAVTTAWVDGQCRNGVRVVERPYDGVTHTDIAKVSATDAVRWIGDRFAGRPLDGDCP